MNFVHPSGVFQLTSLPFIEVAYFWPYLTLEGELIKKDINKFFLSKRGE